MKKIVLIICFISCLICSISCSNANAGNTENHRMETIIEDHSLYIYKFNVKDHGGITHEIIVCRTRLNDGGVSMIEINKY